MKYIFIYLISCAGSTFHGEAISNHEINLGLCRDMARNEAKSGKDLKIVWDEYNKCADNADSKYNQEIKK